MPYIHTSVSTPAHREKHNQRREYHPSVTAD